MEEDDDALVDSSHGVGAAPDISEETIDEGGLPEKELDEPSHPDQAFHNAVKAKAKHALNMLYAAGNDGGDPVGGVGCATSGPKLSL